MSPVGTALRRTGNTAWTPASLSPKFWLDASDTSTLTLDGSSKVNTWADKSANALSFTKVDATGPTSGSVTLNGLNTLSYPGYGNRRLTVSGQTYWTDGTVLLVGIVAKAGTDAFGAVYRPLAGARSSAFPKNPWFDLSVPGAAGASGLAIANYYGTGAAAAVSNVSSTSYSTSAWQLLTFLVDATNGTAASRSSIFVRGGSAIQNNTQTGSLTGADSTAVYVGGDVWGDGQMCQTAGVAEIVCVGGANATEANRQTLRDYLNAKWGIY